MLVERAALSLAAWLFTYALHSTVILAAAWLAAIGLARLACTRPRLRDALPALRERLWKLALVGGLATASVQVGAGLDPWESSVALAPDVAAISAESIAPEPVRTEASPAAPPVHAAPALTPTSWLTILAARALEALAVESLRSASTEVSRDAVPALVAPADTQAAEISALDLRPWIIGAVGVWALVATLGALRSWALWRALRASLREREPIVAGPTRELFDLVCARAGVDGRVRLSRARSLPAPITFGLRRYEICIPPRAETELQREELAALLGHEIAHAKRRDPMWLAIARAIEVLFFFQPLNRRASIWMQDEAEYLCDDAAIVWSGERVALASCLTEIAGWIVHGPRARLACAMAAPGTRLTSRVRRLLDDEHEPHADERGGWVSLAGVGASACVVFLVPGVVVDLERAPDEALGARIEQLEAAGDSWSSPESLVDELRSPSSATPPAAIESAVVPSVATTRTAAALPAQIARPRADADAPLARGPSESDVPAESDEVSPATALEDDRGGRVPSLASELATLELELAELHALARARSADVDTLTRLSALGASLARLRTESAALEALLDSAPAATAFPLDLQETP